MKKIILFFLVVMLILPNVFAQPRDAWRCNNKIVRSGDAKAYVIANCGKPFSDEVITYTDNVIVQQVAYQLPNGKMKILTFEAGRLTTIKDAG